jgi:ABC-type Zn uptake system ZnuABC Zn-binding protein ZnuA
VGAAIGRFLLAAAVLAAAPAFAVTRVVTTTTDLASLAAAVGGDAVAVESIVPPGVDPEAFEARPGDLARLKHADLVVRVGLGFDYWLDALTLQIGERRLLRGGDGYLDASVGIPLLEVRGQDVTNEGGHAHGVANPHYWLDPGNAVIITAAIAEALVRLAPAERNRILANRDAFLSRLEARRTAWDRALAPFAGTKLIAYHNSWPYFARRFRLDILASIEPKAGVAPSPSHLAHLVADGRKAQVRAIVHEPYEPDEASRFVAGKLGVPVVRLAISVGSLEGTSDYLALIDYNVATLARALAGRSP